MWNGTASFAIASVVNFAYITHSGFQQVAVNHLGLGQRYGVLVYTRKRSPSDLKAGGDATYNEPCPDGGLPPVMVSALPELMETQPFVRYLGLNFSISQCSRHLRSARSYFVQYTAHPLVNQTSIYLDAINENGR